MMMRSGQLVSREREQVRREHPEADVGDEARGSFPLAAIEAEGALEERDVPLRNAMKSGSLLGHDAERGAQRH